MALNECKGCSTAFAVGLPRCPHCRSTDFVEQGQDMPKITAHGGPSNAAEPGPELTATTGAVIATSGAWADEAEPAESETVEEESSPGSNSETSSETPSSEPEPSATPRPKRARGTASRSKQGQKAAESSTADSTATGGPETAADTGTEA